MKEIGSFWLCFNMNHYHIGLYFIPKKKKKKRKRKERKNEDLKKMGDGEPNEILKEQVNRTF